MPLGTHGAFLFLVALAVVGGLFAYASVLRCPSCDGKTFSAPFLALLYVPGTCATCDRDFADR